MDINGFCDPTFARVADVFRANFERGAEIGASFSVVRHGNTVVDLWAGKRGREGQDWQRDTIVPVYSLSKIGCALAIMALVEQRELDLDLPVGSIWPEFQVKGKRGVLVRHLLSHRSGVAGWNEPMAMSDLVDRERSVALLAGQAPWWKPDSASGYHANCQGHLLGEIVYRVTGRTIGTYLREDICAPNGIDFHIGLPDAHDHRVGTLHRESESAASSPELTATEHRPWTANGSIAAKALLNPPMRGSDARSRAWRAAEIPSGNGISNARAMAQVISILSGALTPSGSRLLSDPAVQAVFESQGEGKDLVLQRNMRYGLVLALSASRYGHVGSKSVGYWTGWGGSLALADPDLEVGIAYVMNRMSDSLTSDRRSSDLVDAVFASIAG